MLELALRESLHLRHNYIGIEHILLGLLREGEGVGMRLITATGREAAPPSDPLDHGRPISAPGGPVSVGFWPWTH